MLRDEVTQHASAWLFGTVGGKKWSRSVIVRYHEKSQRAVSVGIALQVVGEHRCIFDLQSRGLAARWQSGHAADCKSVYVGSIPARASKYQSRTRAWKVYRRASR